MKTKLRKETIKAFQKSLNQLLPQFETLKEKSDSPIWGWPVSNSLTFFIMLQPVIGHDQFVIEIAWSNENTFPWGDPGKLSSVDLPKCRGRLSRLWAAGSESPPWDFDPAERARSLARDEARERGQDVSYPPDTNLEEMLRNVIPLVEDAIEKIRLYAMPLFVKVAEKRGVGLASS